LWLVARSQWEKGGMWFVACSLWETNPERVALANQAAEDEVDGSRALLERAAPRVESDSPGWTEPDSAWRELSMWRRSA
jgi:hypothetical protein